MSSDPKQGHLRNTEQRNADGSFEDDLRCNSRHTHTHGNTLTMYMGDPHRVAAIMLLWRYRAKPKSAAEQKQLSQYTRYYYY